MKKKVPEDLETRQARLARARVQLEKLGRRKQIRRTLEHNRYAIFSHKLRALRESLGLSQDAFATLTGVSVWTLRSHEQKDPPWSLIQEYAKIFGITTDSFWDIDQEGPLSAEE